MLKKELRLNFTNFRNSLSVEEIESSSMAIATHLESLPIWEFEYYHIFLSILEKKELNTGPIVASLHKKGKKTVVPKITNDKELEHFEINTNTALSKNSLGIPEPVSAKRIPANLIDLVFVPLLAFDKQGHRVGYGKGYYDIFLSQCRPDVVKIGLSLFEAVDRISDLSDTDIPMDYCVTPLKVYSF